MIKHLLPNSSYPSGVVILGGSGFIGTALEELLTVQGIPFLSISKGDMDLTTPDAVTKLTAILKPEDIIIFLSV